MELRDIRRMLRDFLGLSRDFWNCIRVPDNLSLYEFTRGRRLLLCLGAARYLCFTCILSADNAFEYLGGSVVFWSSPAVSG